MKHYKEEHAHRRANHVDGHAKGQALQSIWHGVSTHSQHRDDAHCEHKRPRPPIQKTDERENRSGYVNRVDHFFLGAARPPVGGGGGGSLGFTGPVRIVTGFGFFIS